MTQVTPRPLTQDRPRRAQVSGSVRLEPGRRPERRLPVSERHSSQGLRPGALPQHKPQRAGVGARPVQWSEPAPQPIRPQVSVRGRRIQRTPTNRRLIGLMGMLLSIFLVGCFGVLLVNASSAQLAFQIRQDRMMDSQLTAQIEVLERDAQLANSSGTLTKKAASMGYLVPGQPGAVAVSENGDVVEQRPADPAKNQPLVDLSGVGVSALPPTSDTGDRTAPAPESMNATAAIPAVAPYGPNRN